MPPRVTFLISSNKKIRDLRNGIGKRTGTDFSASAYDYCFVSELLRRRVSKAEAAAALAHRPGAHRTDAAYCWQTVERAAERLGERR